MLKKLIYTFIILTSFAQVLICQEAELHNKYLTYRERLLNEWIIISPNVEQFGVNIPAVDRRIDASGNPIWVSWSDGNSNFNHWLGILATEYRLLKNNNQNYNPTLEMLVYALMAIERLDLYSEYCLRHHHGLVDSTKPDYTNIKYPDDINGFLLRDDVSLGFWKQYHNHFRSKYGIVNKLKDGTNLYLSVFQRGAIPKQGMSQDNIIYMMQSLALIKFLVDNEPINKINIKFINTYIPDYLKEKGIVKNGTIYFDKWIDDIIDRLVKRMQHPYPEREIVLKPIKWKARPSKVNIGGLMHSRWYLSNPITNDLVAEGNGEDMGVWMNSFGVAEVANFITGKNYHFDNSDKGLSEYLFKSLLFKNMKLLKIGGLALPDPIDDYMFRALASVADINWNKSSYKLLFLLGDKRKGWTYEHNQLILFIIHKNKYSKVYKPGIEVYEKDKQYFLDLLKHAPLSGPSTDDSRPDYHPYWSSSSRLNWPENEGNRNTKRVMEFAGMDYLFTYNLYRLVFSPENYNIKYSNEVQNKTLNYKKYKKPNMEDKNIQFFHSPPIQKN